MTMKRYQPTHLKPSSIFGVIFFLASNAAIAAVPQTLIDACQVIDQPPVNYAFCDDGVPNAGGRTINNGGALAMRVPHTYGGDGFTGLPENVGSFNPALGIDPDGNIAVDVDLSLPLMAPPEGGHPMIVFMHGCCSGTKTSWESTESLNPATERWHYNNSWYATRGYVAVTHTARGFTSGGRGSTGESGLMSRNFEINDYQHLACQIYAAAEEGLLDDADTGRTIRINPEKIVVTGGSYGGGFSYLALTDPIWTCNAETGADGTRMKLAASLPRYTWTDLVYSLVPTGRHFSEPSLQPRTDACDSGGKQLPRLGDGSFADCAETPTPTGVPKVTIVSGLFGSGAGATFPSALIETFNCINPAATYPPENVPSCTLTPLQEVLPAFSEQRSAYYQNHFFDNIVNDPEYRIPVFSAGTTTDLLFPMTEHRRMHNRLLAAVPDYPLQSYFGDYQHFNQNKATEWADLCGDDFHICTTEDYPLDPNTGLPNFNVAPSNLQRVGVTTRLNQFVDHYTQPAGNPDVPAPNFDVTASVQICAQNATTQWPANQPGERFTADSFEELFNAVQLFGTDVEAPNTPLTLTNSSGQASTVHEVPTNQNSVSADPIGDMNGCHTGTSQANVPGIVSYESPELDEELVMVGGGILNLNFSVTGDADQLNGSVMLHTRLYDVFPDGTALMVDRGPRRITLDEAAAGEVSYQLFGNVYRFVAGNKLRLEIMQDDDGPGYLKDADFASSTTINSVRFAVPRRLVGAPVPRNDVALTALANSSGGAGATVSAGSFSVTNRSGQSQTLSELTLSLSNAEVLSEIQIDVNGQVSTANVEGDTVTIPVNAVTIDRDAALTITATATLANEAASRTDRYWPLQSAIAHDNHGAAHAHPELQGLALIALILAVVIVAYRTRWAAALLALSLFIAGCGSSSEVAAPGELTPTPPPAPGGATTSLQLTALNVTGDQDAQAVEFEQLPILLSNLTLTQ